MSDYSEDWDSELGPWPERIAHEEHEARYVRGYLAEVSSPSSEISLEEAARLDLAWFIERVEDEASESGYARAVEDLQAQESDELVRLEREVERLREELKEADPENLRELALQNELLSKNLADEKSRAEGLLASLAFELGKLRDSSPTNYDDVEAWAHQDGWNEVIGKVMEKIVELQAKERT